MNIRFVLLVSLALPVAPSLFSQPQPEAPVPVTQAQPTPDSGTLITPPAGENQRVYGPRYTSLVAPETVRELSDRFRAAYGQAASPRIVVFVNRALADAESDLKITGRTEKVYESTNRGKEGEPTQSVDRSTENTYAANETPKQTLADQQTVRDIERLFGRVFRNAGARLADAHAAAALLDEAPETRLGSEQGARQREALKQAADIAIEVLVSSREITLARLSGDATYAVPDIQATAIRLSDAAIVGQAAASDVLGSGTQAGHVVRQFGVPDVTEATAFALMEDMLTGANAPVAAQPEQQ